MSTSTESVNFNRLANSLLGVCLDLVRDVLKKTAKPNLSTAINGNRTTLQNVLNRSQREILFPSPLKTFSGKAEGLDFSLLYTLIRNIADVQEPRTGWGRNTLDTPVRDVSVGANIERLRKLRNEIFAHSTTGKISNEEFTVYWREIENCIFDIEVVLGCTHYTEELAKMKSKDMDPVSTEMFAKTFCSVVKEELTSIRTANSKEEAEKNISTEPQKGYIFSTKTIEAAKRELYAIARRLCAVDSRPVNVLLFGTPGVGKSSFINTMNSVLCGNYVPLASGVGRGPVVYSRTQRLTCYENCGFSSEVAEVMDDQNMQTFIPRLPNLIDFSGFFDLNPECIEILDLILQGCIDFGSSATNLAEIQASFGLSTLRKYTKCRKERRVDVILYMHSCYETPNEVFLSTIWELARKHSHIPIYTLMSKYDRVENAEIGVEAFNKKKHKIAEAFNIVGASELFILPWTNFCDDTSFEDEQLHLNALKLLQQLMRTEKTVDLTADKHLRREVERGSRNRYKVQIICSSALVCAIAVILAVVFLYSTTQSKLGEF